MKNYYTQVLADVVGVVALGLGWGWLQGWLVGNPTAVGLFFLGLYILFCFGVNSLRKLQPTGAEPVAWLKKLDFRGNRTAVFLLALAPIVLAVFAQVDLNGFISSTAALGDDQFPEVHEGEVSLYFMFGPSFLWLGVALFYLVVMLTKVEATAVPATRAYWLREFFGLSVNNLMLISYAAYLSTLIMAGGNWLGWVLALLWLGVAFGAPRLLGYLANPTLPGLVTFAGLFLFTAVRLAGL
jgi:hypothetical protein